MDGAEVLIPLTIFAGGFAMIFGIYYLKTRQNMAMIEKGMNPKEFDQFSLELFKKWGVGKKEKNNGVGIIFSSKLRKLRIEVGKGMESKLTNAEAKYIIDSLIIPEFKRSAYFEGTLKGLQAVIKEIQ